MKLASDSSIAIIGGADGPTAIFVAGDPTAVIIASAIAVFLIILSILFIVKKRNKK